jgi:response regulator RpfG family c-di-GMP phosphodiesterase
MVHRETREKSANRFVFLTNMEVDRSNIAKILMAGRARWLIEDHFNTQKNRGGSLHHKYSRNNFNAIKNWHNTRQLAYLIKELVKHTIEVQELIKTKKLTWKELWEIINGYLYFCFIDGVMESFESWSKMPRQVRLE